MKLLFDKTTRRMAGTIEGSEKGLPSNLIVITAPMPATPETAYLNADNITVGTKALTAAENKARNAGAGGKLPPPPKPPISKLEFMSLFTDAELAAIFTAAKTNVAMEVWVEKLKAAMQVHLDNPQLIAGVKALEAAKLIKAGRAAVILK